MSQSDLFHFAASASSVQKSPFVKNLGASAVNLQVAISIVSYKNPDDVTRCLRALESSTHNYFEIIICENGGADAYAQLSAILPPSLSKGQIVRCIQAPGNLGYAGGVNLCVAATPGADAWWVLNPDTEPRPDALAALVERLSVGDCDAVGGPVYGRGGRIQSYGGRWRSWLARAESIGMGRDMADPVDAFAIERTQNYLNGASMLISRRFLEFAGPIREDYFLYCEEVEWCLRGVARGMRLGFAPAGVVYHEHGTTTGAGKALAIRPKTPIYLGERNKILVTRDCFGARLGIAAIFSLTSIMLKYGPPGAWRQMAYALSGWWAGLQGQRGAPEWPSSTTSPTEI